MKFFVSLILLKTILDNEPVRGFHMVSKINYYSSVFLVVI